MREVKGSAAESYARANLWFGVFALVILVAVFVGLLPTIGGKDDPAPTASASVQKGSQVPLWHKIPAECRVEGVPIAYECLEGLTEVQRQAVRCEHEDGNPDGMPCVWIDPQSRDLYYVSSAEYRN